MEVKSKNGNEISFSDFEFENFNSLANNIAINTRYKIPDEIYIAQAKMNRTFNYFILLISSAFLAFLGYRAHLKKSEIDRVIVVFSCFSILFIYASLRRALTYTKWLKAEKSS